ncbi:hypothetical protein [Fulvivirga sp.]|uniref:hypothetical protein n=1 Tax=Fulvivirga sp. TaxID=1931237 RepID=UPI0032EBD781
MRNCLIIFTLILNYNVCAQDGFSSDLSKTLELIYKADHEVSKKAVKNFYNDYPNHTARLLVRAYQMRWEHYPIFERDEATYKLFIQVLDSAETSARKVLNEDKNNNENAYYYMTAHIMRAELFALNDNMVKASIEGKNAFEYIKKGFEWCETNPEFYTTTGLYIYYIEFYREKGFFYRSLLWPFSKGDKKKGLEYLKEASQKATFTKVEALYYLAHLNYKMEASPANALPYANQLVRQYPSNPKFIDLKIEMLIADKQYSKAGEMLLNFNVADIPYLNARKCLYQGILTLTSENNYRKAETQIKVAIKMFEELLGDQDHYLSLAYMYLGTLENIANNASEANDLLSKAKNYAKYPYIHRQLEKLGA